MSYFIYSVVKVMESKWSFVKKLDRGRASFSRYWHLKFTPEKPNSYITISVSKLQEPCCSSYNGRMLRIVTHCYAVLFSQKLILCKTNNIFYSRECYIWHKDNKFWKFIKKWTWGHVGQFSKFCLRQLLFAFKEFRMKTRLLNISKTTNATNFTKTILRSSYKVLLGRCNLTAPKRHIFLLRALEF